MFEEQKAHRLWLDVKEHNQRTRHVYQSLDFVEEGVLRECWKNGNQRESLVLMSQLRPEYLANKAEEIPAPLKPKR
ncbi:GNAT family N-acetyltransferase [Desmospora profundinema]|uniref:RimJ/RimL family protein N-acetyltransferase n=1 Tax=Desmospora profundinema TaxID=1571184 RepID=A0ABU1IQT8_9BACL|nr:GNAT family protein [Desmospora profundinema]MDR6227149.1 RimJ/RimL family protein N-acetyltransferase [Desmospora profundinema]